MPITDVAPAAHRPIVAPTISVSRVKRVHPIPPMGGGPGEVAKVAWGGSAADAAPSDIGCRTRLVLHLAEPAPEVRQLLGRHLRQPLPQPVLRVAHAQ